MERKKRERGERGEDGKGCKGCLMAVWMDAFGFICKVFLSIIILVFLTFERSKHRVRPRVVVGFSFSQLK